MKLIIFELNGCHSNNTNVYKLGYLCYGMRFISKYASILNHQHDFRGVKRICNFKRKRIT